MDELDTVVWKNDGRVSRRTVLRWSAGAAAAVSLDWLGVPRTAHAVSDELSIMDLQGLMASGQLTARGIVELYLGRIEALDKQGPTLLRLAYAFEQATKARRPPRFLPTASRP